MKKLFGLGKGLGSLIPENAENVSIPKESVFMVEIHKIEPNPDQPRRDFDEAALKDLSDSIREHGIIQPLLVYKVKTETSHGLEVRYQLIAGERRLRAAKLARLPRVPVVIRNDMPGGSKKESESTNLELALIENIQRENLNPMEEAEAYDRLQKEFGLTQQEVANKVGKSRPAVANTIRLLGLPQEIIQSIREGKLNKAEARGLLAFADPAKQREMYQGILAGAFGSKDIEGLASAQNGPSPKKLRNADRRYIDLQENLKETLKVPVVIQAAGTGGKIVIHFASVEELTRVAKDIID